MLAEGAVCLILPDFRHTSRTYISFLWRYMEDLVEKGEKVSELCTYLVRKWSILLIMRRSTVPLQRRASLPDLTRIHPRKSELMSPIHLPESPFPAHVQLYLGSCRTKCLADIHGASIFRLAEPSEACRKELELMSEKLDGRRGKGKEERKEEEEPPRNKTYTPFLSLASTAIESVLLSQHPTPLPTVLPPSPPLSPEHSDSFYLNSLPPKPSQRLQAFLTSSIHRPTAKYHHSSKERNKKYPPGAIIGRFSLPRKVEKRGQGSKTECSSPVTRRGNHWPVSPAPGKAGNGFSMVAGSPERRPRRVVMRSSCG